MEDIPEDIIQILNEIAGLTESPVMFSPEWWKRYGESYTTLQERTLRRQQNRWRWTNPHWPQPPTRNLNSTNIPPQNS